MTATYRLALVFTVDGEMMTHRRAHTRSQLKPINRRIERRQHHSITKEAVDSWYADGADDRYDYLFGDNGIYNQYVGEISYEEPEWDEYEIIEEEYSYDPCDYIDYGWASYYYADDEFAIWGDRQVTPEDKRKIEREDVGKSLGEILEEIQQKQRR